MIKIVIVFDDKFKISKRVKKVRFILINKHVIPRIDSNNRKSFRSLCKVLMVKYENRKNTILEQMNYILNNWKCIQNSYN